MHVWNAVITKEKKLVLKARGPNKNTPNGVFFECSGKYKFGAGWPVGQGIDM
jgi:hypothetical protein